MQHCLSCIALVSFGTVYVVCELVFYWPACSRSLGPIEDKLDTATNWWAMINNEVRRSNDRKRRRFLKDDKLCVLRVGWVGDEDLFRRERWVRPAAIRTFQTYPSRKFGKKEDCKIFQIKQTLSLEDFRSKLYRLVWTKNCGARTLLAESNEGSPRFEQRNTKLVTRQGGS